MIVVRESLVLFEVVQKIQKIHLPNPKLDKLLDLYEQLEKTVKDFTIFKLALKKDLNVEENDFSEIKNTELQEKVFRLLGERLEANDANITTLNFLTKEEFEKCVKSEKLALAEIALFRKYAKIK